MARVKVRDNGPYLIEDDDVTVVDATGAEFKIERKPFVLCRCGASNNKPFCDGSHKSTGFQASNKAG